MAIEKLSKSQQQFIDAQATLMQLKQVGRDLEQRLSTKNNVAKVMEKKATTAVDIVHDEPPSSSR